MINVKKPVQLTRPGPNKAKDANNAIDVTTMFVDLNASANQRTATKKKAPPNKSTIMV